MVRAPRHVDGIEVTYARRYEVARDWLFEFRRLTRAGVAWEAMPLAFRDEVACAVAWVFRNEATLVAMGLRDP